MPQLTRDGRSFLDFLAWFVIAAGVVMILRAIFFPGA